MHIHTKPDQRNERIPGGKRRGIKKVAGDLRAAIIIEGAIDNLGGAMPERLHHSVPARRSAATNVGNEVSFEVFTRRE
jgi:hypothetical protein